jgi:hypothetical protein
MPRPELIDIIVYFITQLSVWKEILLSVTDTAANPAIHNTCHLVTFASELALTSLHDITRLEKLVIVLSGKPVNAGILMELIQ